MKKFDVIKITGTSEELLETVEAETANDVRKMMVVKYMDVVLSTQTQLAVRAR